MKIVAINQAVSLIYQELRNYGEIVPSHFAYNLEVYNDGVESGRLTMHCQEYVVIGDYLMFCSDKYSTRRYAEPMGACLLGMPIDCLKTSSVRDSLDLNSQNDKVFRMIAPDDNRTIISAFANRYRISGVRHLIEEINSCGQCSEDWADLIAQSIAGFCH